MSTPWHVIAEHLEATGATIGGVGRRARARICKSCRAEIITGLDGELCALEAIVDPTPLDGLGEVLAQLQGRRTYDLTPDAGRYVLGYRTDWRISHRPARSGRFDVMPEHRCGLAPLPEVASFTETHRLAPPPAEAPF